MVTSTRHEWVLLTYRLPREPSAPRLTVWRAVRRLGALQLGDGLVALPHSTRTLEHLQWLAAGVVEHGGAATVWRAQPATSGEHDALEAALRSAADQEYRTMLAEAEAGLAAELDVAERRRLVRRLRGQLRRIRLRDHFDAPTGGAAASAVDRLARSVALVPA